MNGQIDAGLEVAYLTPREVEVLKLGVRSGAAAVMRAVELQLFGQP